MTTPKDPMRILAQRLQQRRLQNAAQRQQQRNQRRPRAHTRQTQVVDRQGNIVATSRSSKEAAALAKLTEGLMVRRSRELIREAPKAKEVSKAIIKAREEAARAQADARSLQKAQDTLRPHTDPAGQDTLDSLFSNESLEQAREIIQQKQQSQRDLEAIKPFARQDGQVDLVAALQAGVAPEIIERLFEPGAIERAQTRVKQLAEIEPFRQRDGGVDVAEAMAKGVSRETLEALFNRESIRSAERVVAQRSAQAKVGEQSPVEFLAAGGSPNVLLEAGFPQQFVLALASVRDFITPDGRVDAQAAVNSGIRPELIRELGIDPERVVAQQSAQAQVGEQSPVEFLAAGGSPNVLLEAGFPQQFVLALRSVRDFITPDGRVDAQAALNSGIRPELIRELGIDPERVVAQQSAQAKVGEQSPVEFLAAGGSPNVLLEAGFPQQFVLALRSVRDFITPDGRVDVQAALNSGIRPELIRELGIDPERVVAQQSAQAQVGEQSPVEFLAAGGSPNVLLEAGFPQQFVLALRSVRDFITPDGRVDVQAALNSGIRPELIRELGIDPERVVAQRSAQAKVLQNLEPYREGDGFNVVAALVDKAITHEELAGSGLFDSNTAARLVRAAATFNVATSQIPAGTTFQVVDPATGQILAQTSQPTVALRTGNILVTREQVAQATALGLPANTSVAAINLEIDRRNAELALQLELPATASVEQIQARIDQERRNAAAELATRAVKLGLRPDATLEDVAQREQVTQVATAKAVGLPTSASVEEINAGVVAHNREVEELNRRQIASSMAINQTALNLRQWTESQQELNRQVALLKVIRSSTPLDAAAPVTEEVKETGEWEAYLSSIFGKAPPPMPILPAEEWSPDAEMRQIYQRALDRAESGEAATRGGIGAQYEVVVVGPNPDNLGVEEIQARLESLNQQGASLTKELRSLDAEFAPHLRIDNATGERIWIGPASLLPEYNAKVSEFEAKQQEYEAATESTPPLRLEYRVRSAATALKEFGQSIIPVYGTILAAKGLQDNWEDMSTPERWVGGVSTGISAAADAFIIGSLLTVPLKATVRAAVVPSATRGNAAALSKAIRLQSRITNDFADGLRVSAPGLATPAKSMLDDFAVHATNAATKASLESSLARATARVKNQTQPTGTSMMNVRVLNIRLAEIDDAMTVSRIKLRKSASEFADAIRQADIKIETSKIFVQGQETSLERALSSFSADLVRKAEQKVPTKVTPKEEITRLESQLASAREDLVKAEASYNAKPRVSLDELQQLASLKQNKVSLEAKLSDLRLGDLEALNRERLIVQNDIFIIKRAIAEGRQLTEAETIRTQRFRAVESLPAAEFKRLQLSEAINRRLVAMEDMIGKPLSRGGGRVIDPERPIPTSGRGSLAGTRERQPIEFLDEPPIAVRPGPGSLGIPSRGLPVLPIEGAELEIGTISGTVAVQSGPRQSSPI